MAVAARERYDQGGRRLGHTVVVDRCVGMEHLGHTVKLGSLIRGSGGAACDEDMDVAQDFDTGEGLCHSIGKISRKNPSSGNNRAASRNRLLR